MDRGLCTGSLLAWLEQLLVFLSTLYFGTQQRSPVLRSPPLRLGWYPLPNCQRLHEHPVTVLTTLCHHDWLACALQATGALSHMSTLGPGLHPFGQLRGVTEWKSCCVPSQRPSEEGELVLQQHFSFSYGCATIWGTQKVLSCLTQQRELC